MDRLTKRFDCIVAYVGRHKTWGENVPAEMSVAAIRDVLDRLAAYEDTWMTPESIIAAQKALRCFDKIGIKRGNEIVDAELDGRLIVLPCKVGDTVYTAQRGVISELSVAHLELYNDDVWVSWTLMSGMYGKFRMDGFPASDIGKTVFLTREAAEATLGGKSYE